MLSTVLRRLFAAVRYSLGGFVILIGLFALFAMQAPAGPSAQTRDSATPPARIDAASKSWGRYTITGHYLPGATLVLWVNGTEAGITGTDATGHFKLSHVAISGDVANIQLVERQKTGWFSHHDQTVSPVQYLATVDHKPVLADKPYVLSKPSPHTMPASMLTPQPTATPTPTATPATATIPAAATAQSSTVYYADCAAARAAGATPISRGQPGYDAHLDPDGDGTACETQQ